MRRAKKRLACKQKQRAEDDDVNERPTPALDAAILAAAATSTLANEVKQTPDVKIEVENEADERIIDEIKPDAYELQQQWFSQATESAAPTLTLAASIFRIDDIGSDVAPDSLSGKVPVIGKDAKKVPVTPKKLKPASVNRSDFCFDADEVDMQETDSDEEGYSDIDFEEEFEIIECDAGADMYAPEWSKESRVRRKVFSTKNLNGMLKGFPRFDSPTYYFYKLLGGLQFFKDWAECCNKRAKKTMVSSQKPIRDHFEAFTMHEMSIFFGICLQMGSLQLTTLAEYWESQAHHGLSGFSSKMSLERFQFLLEVLNFKALHTEEESFKNDNNSGDNKISTDLKSFVCFFNNRMASVYNCGLQIILNEPVRYWKGKLHWVNDMNPKWRPNAILLHFLTEQSGLVLKILVDIEGPRQKQLARNSKELVMQRLSTAMELLKGRFKKGHFVFTSKYYGSVALCLELGKLGTLSSGFLDSQRFGNCKELVLKNLDHYQFETRFAAFMMMGKYRCLRKSFYFYSSDCLFISPHEILVKHKPKLVSEIDWQLNTPEKIRAHMLDYQLALQRTEIKWERRLIIYVMQLFVLNAFLLYKAHAQKGRFLNKQNLFSYQTFRQDIIASLLTPRDEWSSIDYGYEIDVAIAADNLHTRHNSSGTS
ncbi:uncharacterized protein LOC129236224 [Anastrepha obliqua]|uniref:uncharacterized protein LOC129236224 n=1 Tax=Anastrepha obliqua TaxID=95512 RepID=UPI00240A2482|nr:uncharacterized protein LOC129236224 [Anastrepha obliqua]